MAIRKGVKYHRSRKTVKKDFNLDEIFQQQEEIIYRHEDQSLDDFFVRPAAIIEVLRRIPPQEYNLLKQISPGLIWVFQYEQFFEMGRALRIPIPQCPTKETSIGVIRYAILIYLCMDLEEIYRGKNFNEFDVAIAIIAHELAHVFFHAFDQYELPVEGEEERANDLMEEWGFRKELIAKRNFEKYVREQVKKRRAEKKSGLAKLVDKAYYAA